MSRASAGLALGLVAALAGTGRGQDPAPVGTATPAAVGTATPAAVSSETAALVARWAEVDALDREFGRQRLAVATAQERQEQADAAAAAFRRGKTVEDLRPPPVRAEAERLAAEQRAAQDALAALTTGAARARFVTARDRLVRAWTTLLGDLDRALAARPDDVELHLARASLLVAKGEFGAARRDAEAAVVARPDEPRGLVLLGMCLVTENQFEDAAGLFQRAHDLAPDDERRAYLAIGLFCTNRFAEARAVRDRIARVGDLPPQLAMRCAWWLTDGSLDHEAAAWAREEAAREAEAARGDLPRVTLETTQGTVEVELFEDAAPNAVKGFVELVEAGFYDGLAFHRVIPNLVAQTGDPSTRPGAPLDRHDAGWRLKDDPGPRDPARARGHFRGTLSMARRDAADSATGQVFFVVMPAVVLDELHVALGRVVTGQAVVDRLRPDDRVTRARVTRKRDHPYVADKAP